MKDQYGVCLFLLFLFSPATPETILSFLDFCLFA